MTYPDGRMELSQGTEPAAAAGLTHGPFSPGARVPRMPWEPVGNKEASRWSSISGGVVLRDLGRETLEPFRELGWHQITRLQEIERLRALPATEEALRALRSTLEQIRRPTPGVAVGPIESVIVRPPGLLCSTVDRDRGAYFTGLHVDSWDNTGPELRHHAAGRICVNLGREDRFFLFLPITIGEAATVVSCEQPLESGGDRSAVNRVADAFMNRFPGFPVLRLRVKPGEAYIAPTENLIHDGSTEGQTWLDLTVTWRGF